MPACLFFLGLTCAIFILQVSLANLVGALGEDKSTPVAGGVVECLAAVLRTHSEPDCVTAGTRCLAALMGLPEARDRLAKAGELMYVTAHCSIV